MNSMKKYILLLGIISSSVLSVVAQEKKDILSDLTKDKPRQGRVRIFQDPIIEALLRNSTAEVIATGDKNVIKANGYRIQVFAGNNTREARSHAMRLGAQVAELFPELSVYTTFISPRWICRVGDFRSIEEADAMLRQLRDTRQFKEVSIVKEVIQIPLD